MMKKAFTVILFGIILLPGFATARTEELVNPLEAFRSYRDLDEANISVPTVLEHSVADLNVERLQFAIFDTTTSTFEPYYLRQEMRVPVKLSSSYVLALAYLMGDNDAKTYADFPLLDSSTPGRVIITISSVTPITTSAITMLLDNNVSLPTHVEIKALVGGKERIVVARKKLLGQVVTFPETISNSWTATLDYNQPLRISELYLNQNNAVSSRALRFLAKPNHQYRMYFDPDRYVTAKVGEVGDLASAKNVKIVGASSALANPEYLIADSDKDSVPDVNDNCVSFANPEQVDVDANGRGDACDDFDQDGLINAKDNCPDSPNRNQSDEDGDKLGDVCDKEESRVTEKYVWLPWVGMGFAALVLLSLFVVMARSTKVPGADA